MLIKSDSKDISRFLFLNKFCFLEFHSDFNILY